MNDETVKPPITLAEFHERCASLIAELAGLLDGFDDETDPAGVADAVVARYLSYHSDRRRRGCE